MREREHKSETAAGELWTVGQMRGEGERQRTTWTRWPDWGTHCSSSSIIRCQCDRKHWWDAFTFTSYYCDDDAQHSLYREKLRHRMRTVPCFRRSISYSKLFSVFSCSNIDFLETPSKGEIPLLLYPSVITFPTLFLHCGPSLNSH